VKTLYLKLSIHQNGNATSPNGTVKAERPAPRRPWPFERWPRATYRLWPSVGGYFHVSGCDNQEAGRVPRPSGVSFDAFVRDRITGTHHIPQLAELVDKAAKALNLGKS